MMAMANMQTVHVAKAQEHKRSTAKSSGKRQRAQCAKHIDAVEVNSGEEWLLHARNEEEERRIFESRTVSIKYGCTR